MLDDNPSSSAVHPAIWIVVSDVLVQYGAGRREFDRRIRVGRILDVVSSLQR